MNFRNKPRQFFQQAIVLLLLMMPLAISAQTDTLMIDFGPQSSASDLPWNNFSDLEVTGQQSPLYDSEYKATPFQIELSNRFSGFNDGGVTNPDAAIGIPSKASSDSYFGNTVDFSGALEPDGGLMLSGLDPAETYNFIIYCSRQTTENRETSYTLVGETTVSGALNPANNTSNVLELAVMPKANGTVDLNVAPGDNNVSGYKFYYLNAIKVVYNDIDILQPALTLTAPNGGEAFDQGSTQSISWTGENLTEDVIVSYSSENGAIWLDLDTVENTVTSLDWLIPEIPSLNYLVKVRSFVAEDISDATFEVIGELPALDTVLIDFGPASGKSELPWNNINFTDSSGVIVPLFDSQVKATPFGFRVIDDFAGFNTGGVQTPDPSLGIPSTASSDSYYGNTVVLSGALEPTGGIQLSGLDPLLSYSIVIYGSRVASDNRETSYTLVGASTVSGVLNPSNNTSEVLGLDIVPRADGTVDLNVAPGDNNTNSNKFYYLNAIKIIYDDIDFAQPTLTVTAPNGGEQFVQESTTSITWTGANLTDDVLVSYSPDNGGSWIDVDTVESSVTSIEWLVPLVPSPSYLVKVKSFTAEDVSDATFTVVGELPALDTIMIDFGSTSNISPAPWNNFPDRLLGSKLELLRNEHNLQTAINMEVIDGFTGVNESGSTTPSAALGIPASATSDSYFGNVEDWSGSISPTGGFLISGLKAEKTYTFELFSSRMSVGDNRETKFVFTGSEADSVYLDAANNEARIASISVLPDAAGEIQLIASPGENNTNGYGFYYLGALKIIYDEEEALPAVINVLAPNGGEEWLVGAGHEISWESTNLTDDVEVFYSADNGSSWTLIETVSSDLNSLSWTIPDAVSAECLVKVSSGDTEDVSDTNFSISSALDPAIILEQPNGGEHWVAGTDQYIRWTTNLLTEDIEVSYSLDNGGNWTVIETVGVESSSLKWTLPETLSDECLVMLESGAYSDVSAATFSIIEAPCSNTIVVLGSSTSAGTGANPIDSAWVWRYRAALAELSADYQVINLGVGGYTTFKICPTGTVFEEGITEVIDESKNVTKALTYNPYAIIVNMPSNDAINYTAAQTLANMALVSDYAAAVGVKTWICTTQPRNFSDPGMIATQVYLADEIPKIYGDYSLDFWTDLADDAGFIASAYDSGDGVHLNNAGHRLLFERVMEKGIHLEACDAITSVASQSVDLALKVYPNPAGAQFTLSLYMESEGELEVLFFDMTGRELGVRTSKELQAGAHSLSYNRNAFPASESLLIGVVRITSSQDVRESYFKVILK